MTQETESLGSHGPATPASTEGATVPSMGSPTPRPPATQTIGAATQTIGAATQTIGAATQTIGAATQTIGAATQTIGAATQMTGAAEFSPAALPRAALAILKDPGGSLGALHRPGQPALITGLVFGLTTAVLVPLLQILFLKLRLGELYSFLAPSAGDVFKSILGGVLFLAVGAGLSLLLRRAATKTAAGNWTDDIYLFGSASLFILVGVLAAGLLSLPREPFFQHLGVAVGMAAFFLAATSYLLGASAVFKLEPRKAPWLAASVLFAALFVGSLLGFSPFAGSTAGPTAPRPPSGAPTNDIRGLEKMMGEMFK